MVFTATAAILLDGEAFNRLVAEEDLRTWEQEGYIYTKKRGKSGMELYRTYGPKWKWLYQARRVGTSGVGGGAMRIRIAIPAGTTAELVQAVAVGPASNTTLVIAPYDEDGAGLGTFASIAAGVSRNCALPSIGTAANAHGNIQNTVGMMMGPGQYLYIDAAASLQNETMTVGVVFLMGAKSTPVWDTTGSVATVTLADSTISADNTWQAVLMP